MFIALRDIKFAKGRFALIGTVVVLITILVGFLTGLTAGLANQNISSILSLQANQIALSVPADGDKLSYSNSSITDGQLKALSQETGVSSVQPLGISRAKFMGTKKNLNAAAFGVNATYGDTAPKASGYIVVSKNAADEGDIHVGDVLKLSNQSLTVERISDESWYSHSPIVWMNFEDWSQYSQKIGQTGNPTAALITTDNNASIATPDGLIIKTPLTSLVALDAFKSEIGSLAMMTGMLFLISALVIGAFFTVWTIQRKNDIAILKALGVSTKALVKDALAQTLIVLVIGVGIGIGITAILGALASTALPFILSPLTIGIPVIAMILMGLLGSVFALRSVTKADPLTALASSN